MITFLNDKPNNVGSYHLRHNAYNLDSSIVKAYIIKVLSAYGLNIKVLRVIGHYAEIVIV